MRSAYSAKPFGIFVLSQSIYWHSVSITFKSNIFDLNVGLTHWLLFWL